MFLKEGFFLKKIGKLSFENKIALFLQFWEAHSGLPNEDEVKGVGHDMSSLPHNIILKSL